MTTQTLLRLKPEGLWHRRAGDADATACGEEIKGPIASREQKPEDNNLCPICFTQFEIDTGKMERFKRDLKDNSDPILRYGEENDEEPTDPNAEAHLTEPIKSND